MPLSHEPHLHRARVPASVPCAMHLQEVGQPGRFAADAAQFGQAMNSIAHGQAMMAAIRDYKKVHTQPHTPTSSTATPPPQPTAQQARAALVSPARV